MERIRDRLSLSASFDRLRRDIDTDGAVAGSDAFDRQAFDILTSPRLLEALDLSREDPRLRDRYGFGPADSSVPTRFRGLPPACERFLVARRLIEAGARCVTLAVGDWDLHDHNHAGLQVQLPYLDRGVLSALIEDLDLRGMLSDVTVRRLGRVWPLAADQPGRGAGPLARGFRAPHGGRRDAGRPGHRLHDSPG